MYKRQLLSVAEKFSYNFKKNEEETLLFDDCEYGKWKRKLTKKEEKIIKNKKI